VVFRRHTRGHGPKPDKFHGYAVDWKHLTDEQKNALIEANVFDSRGRPITHD
jgi:hypothetical protein